jgi:hypothetical protein
MPNSNNLHYRGTFLAWFGKKVSRAFGEKKSRTIQELLLFL